MARGEHDDGEQDRNLVSSVLAGDGEAFAFLVSKYSPRVFSMALRLTKNPHDAEEVVQDVFVTVHRKLRFFEQKSAFSSWLYRVTVNAALMKLRKRRQDRTTPIAETPEVERALTRRSCEQPDTFAAYAREELHALLEDAIMKLPDEYRPVFVLRDVDGLSSEEVAEMLELSVPAVKSRLHRSRRMLQRRLSKVYREYAPHRMAENG